MKTLNITFTDREFAEMRRIKFENNNVHNWHKIILRAMRALKKDE